MSKFINEFKTFITKGNVMDLAIGVIVGGMFTKIVNSIANDILMPFVSLLTGKTTFQDMFVALDGGAYATLEEARTANAAVVAYGNLIQLILDFLITALCLFLIVKGINKLRAIEIKKIDELSNKIKAKMEKEKEDKKD
ncbi:MAG: mscL [Clostridia bacterium]|nr:mscL [Clostridia bacterium]